MKQAGRERSNVTGPGVAGGVLDPARPDYLPANLRHLPAAARAALEAASQDGVSSDGTTRPGATTLLGRDGNWYPLHGESDASMNRKLVERLLAGPEPSLVILIGAGLGYLLDAIEERSHAMKVLVLEPVPAVARLMLARRDWAPWLSSGRLTLLVGPDYQGAAEAWRVVAPDGRTPPTFALPVLEKVAPEATARAKQVAARIVAGARANEVARKRFAGRYLLNTLANLPAIAAEGDTAALAGLWAGLPAVVVAAGPSLDRNLADLEAIADRVLIVAVDTAVRPLLAAGLRPQIAVAVDPSELNARHLRGVSDLRGMWLVGEGSIDAALMEQFAGRTFTFRVSNHHPWPWLASRGASRGTLQAWGSVLTTAFDLALHVGADPIAFVGADLAYSDGQLYCRNTVYEGEWRHLDTLEQRADAFRDYIKSQGQVADRDVLGNPVLTAPRFLQFRDWLVSRSQTASSRVINATGGGILMGGRIEQAPLASLALPAMTGAAERIQLALRRAWSANEAVRITTLEGLAESAGHPDTDTLDAWFAFGGDTAPRARIEEAARDAHAALAALWRKRRYLAAARSAYDALAPTREAAETQSHPAYAVARREAPSSMAHALLEHRQRTYPVDPDRDVPGILTSMASLAPAVRALDVGCGAGRTMEALVRAGVRVDGVDMSAAVLVHARSNPALAGCRFFASRGNDCGEAPDGVYDVAYSYLCFRYIPSRTVRRELLRAMVRALRPDGLLLVQLPIHRDWTAESIPEPHVSWRADHYDGHEFNGTTNVWPTPDLLPLIYDDFAEVLRDVRLQFLDFAPERGLPTQLVVSGSPTVGLAARLYAQTSVPPGDQLSLFF